MDQGLKIARGFTLPLELVTEASAIVATRGAGKSSASAVLVEEAFKLGVQSVIFDRTGVYWGLRSNAKGDGDGLAIYVLGGPHGDVPLEPAAGRMVADLVVDSGHSFVLDLSDFSKGQAIRFSADFLERLYDRKARNRTTLLLVMDEAHFYAPQTPRGGFRGDAARLMGAMEDVVGLGRSRGLGVVLTTQRTQALNKAVLDLIETLLVMRMLSPRAREAVRGWIQEKHEDDDRGVIASLDSLPTGTAWVWAPLRGMLEKVALRRIRTFDAFYAPPPGEVAVEPTARRSLDLDALGEQMRATAERAKADDPAELRKQIRDRDRDLADLSAEMVKLKGELEARPAEAKPEVVWPFTDEEFDAAIQEAEVLITDAAQARDAAERLIEAAGDTGDRGEVILGALRQWRERKDAEAVSLDKLVHVSGGRPPAPRPATAAPPRPAPRSALPKSNGAAATDFQLGGPHRKLLMVLANYPEGRSKRQLALQAGYSESGGGFNNPLGQLRSAGYVTPAKVEPIRITQEGLDALGAFDPLPTGPDLLRHWLSQQSLLGGPGVAMLQVLAEQGAMEREELAERAGMLARGEAYAPDGGGFNNPLGKLRSLGLVARGWPARLTDEFAEAIR